MKIYISGGITGVPDYREHFEEAEKCLLAAGHTVVNPARVNGELPIDTTHDEYMKMSLVMLDMCEGIFLLEGWENSKGATIEFEYAYEHKLTILFEGGRG